MDQGQLLLRDGIQGGPQMSVADVVVDGEPTALVRLWVGNEASEDDVSTAHEILSSIRIEGSERWVHEVFTSHGVRVGLTRPENWTIDAFERVYVMDAPNPVLLLSSPGVGIGKDKICEPLAFGAPGKLASSGVVILVSDASTSWIRPTFGRKPDVLDPTTAITDRTIECEDGTFRRLHFGFEVGRRPISINVIMGSAAETDLSPIVWRILESLELESDDSGSFG